MNGINENYEEENMNESITDVDISKTNISLKNINDLERFVNKENETPKNLTYKSHNINNK